MKWPIARSMKSWLSFHPNALQVHGFLPVFFAVKVLTKAGGNIRIPLPRRSIAQSGSASGLGPEGRGFESFCSDHLLLVCTRDIVYILFRRHR